MSEIVNCDECKKEFDLVDEGIRNEGGDFCDACLKKEYDAAYADYRAHNPAEGEIDSAGAYEKNDPKHPTYPERALALADMLRKEMKGK